LLCFLDPGATPGVTKFCAPINIITLIATWYQ